MELNDDANFSDDEVFFGKMTLKEVKKRVLMGIPQKIKSTSCDDKSINEFKLIDRSSQPNMHLNSYMDGLIVEQLKSTSDPLFNRNKEVIQSKKAADLPIPLNRDSFLEMEKYVEEQSSESKSNDLDNTLELVDFILNHGQFHKKEEDIQDTSVNKQDVDDYNKYFNCDMKVTKDEMLSQSARQNEGKLLSNKEVDDYNKDFNCDMKVSKDEMLSQSARQNEGKLLNKQEVDDYNKDFNCDMKVTKVEMLSQSARQNEGKLLNKQEVDDYNKDFNCDMKVTKDEMLSQSARQNEGKLLNKQEVDDYNKYFNCDMLQQVTKDEIISQTARQNERELHNGHCVNAAKLLQNFASTATLNTPVKCEQVEYKGLPTPNSIKKPKVTSSLNTPRNNEKFPCIFKTPTVSQSKFKSKAFEHVTSPIATYIRQSPQVPLVKDIHPKKPLPTTSLIPKLVKNISEGKINDKENIVLPQLAYRSAKKTILINVDKDKMPQGNWAQKLPSPTQKPVVLKHQRREIGRKPLISQQDSVVDLSLHQADVSICTEKLAFTKLKKPAPE